MIPAVSVGGGVLVVIGSALVLAVLLVAGARGAIATTGALAVMGLAAIADHRTGRLPDRLVALATFPIVAALVVAVPAGRTDLAVAAVGGAALGGLPVLAVHLLGPTSLGFGDVKAAAVVGAAVGLAEPRLALLAVCAAAGTAAAVALARRADGVALGPYLVGAAICTSLLAALVGGEVP